MAVAYNIANLSTKKDLEEKRSEFFKTLRLKARLNRNYEQAMLTRKQLDDLGVKPVAETPRSLEEERRDDIFQQQLAEKYLRELMTPDEARKVVADLMASNDVYEFNSNFPGIKDALKGRRNISATFFKQFFKRYLTTLKATGGIYSPIPLPEDLIARLPGDLRDAWEGWSKGEIDPKTGKRVTEAELIKRTGDTLGQSPEMIARAVQTEKDIQSQDSSEDALPAGRRVKLKPMMEGPEGFLSAREVSRPGFSAEGFLQKTGKPTEQLTPEQADRVFQIGIDSPKLTSEKLKVMLKAKGLSTKGNKNELFQRFASTYKGEQGSGLFMQTPQRPSSNYGPMEIVTGKGTKPMLHVNGRKVKCGRGFGREKVPLDKKLLPIGKYWLYLPTLFDEHTVMIRVPNKSATIRLRQMFVSDLFKRVFVEALENGSLNRDDFNKLNDEEQQYLWYVCKKCKVEDKIGFPSNFTYDDAKEIERFNLVRGQILAGNNDPELLREMKTLVLKMIAEDKIRKRTVTDLLYELTVLAH